MTQSVIARRIIGGHLFEIDTDKDRLDIALIHDFLSRCSHWARGIPRARWNGRSPIRCASASIATTCRSALPAS